MIFAAGIGSRLKPFTLSHPKALVEVGGVPMLERVILKLKAAGVGHIVVNVHHFADQIITFIKENNNFGCDILVSDERDELLDTGGGLLKAAPLFLPDVPIVLHNADILTDFSIADMARDLDCDARLLVSRRSSSRALYFDKDMRMRGWGNLKAGEIKPANLCTDGLNPLAFGGVHIIKPSVLGALKEYAPAKVFSIIDFYVHACPTLCIEGYAPADGTYRWFDVGKPETLEAARKSLC